MKLGPDGGNSGAIIRWGKYLDNGIWVRTWRFRKLWFKYRFMYGYFNFGFFVIHWNN